MVLHQDSLLTDDVSPPLPPLRCHTHMHSLSLGTGVAINRLLEPYMQSADLAMEIAAFAELARHRLGLDNAACVAAMLFTEPLIGMWRPHWKFAYVTGLILGIKLTTEGFYTIDVVNHLTAEFTLGELLQGERHVFCLVINADQIALRFHQYRNCLANVTFQAFHLADTAPLDAEKEPAMHVLVVDKSAVVRLYHRLLVLQLVATATVQCCSRCPSPLPLSTLSISQRAHLYCCYCCYTHTHTLPPVLINTPHTKAFSAQCGGRNGLHQG